jgi:hypothetical protein
MLGVLGPRASARKLRLFGCACVRRAWPLLDEQRLRAVEMAEEMANGRVAPRTMQLGPFDGGEADAPAEAALAAEMLCHAEAGIAAQEAALASARAAAQAAAERSAQAGLLRDVFNPFWSPPVEPAWRGGTVARLAQAAYDECVLPAGILDNTRLGILADALEDAGCVDEELLSHLRAPGPHVRGCWVLDFLTGRE